LKIEIPFQPAEWGYTEMCKVTNRRAMTAYPRITINPDQMGGLPCIRGLRIPVAAVVEMVSEGMTEAEIINDYPDLEPEDIREALRYAAEAVRERELPINK
jgi:uncharacterized protein (DUF433 family)